MLWFLKKSKPWSSSSLPVENNVARLFLSPKKLEFLNSNSSPSPSETNLRKIGKKRSNSSPKQTKNDLIDFLERKVSLPWFQPAILSFSSVFDNRNSCRNSNRIRKSRNRSSKKEAPKFRNRRTRKWKNQTSGADLCQEKCAWLQRGWKGRLFLSNGRLEHDLSSSNVQSYPAHLPCERNWGLQYNYNWHPNRVTLLLPMIG